MVLGVILRGQNLKDEFSELVLGIWNWFSRLVRFKSTDDAIASVKQDTDGPWHHVGIEIWKISPLDSTNQKSIKAEVLGNHVFIP